MKLSNSLNSGSLMLNLQAFILIVICSTIFSGCTTVPVEGKIHYREDGTIKRKDWEDLYNKNLVLSTYFDEDGNVKKRAIYNGYGMLLEERYYHSNGTLKWIDPLFTVKPGQKFMRHYYDETEKEIIRKEEQIYTKEIEN